MARFSLGREPGLELVGDGLGDVALEDEHVFQRPVVMLGPRGGVRARVHEPGVDAQPLAVALHAALDHVGHSQQAGDLAQVARCAGLVLHHRGAADDLQVGDLGQVGEHLILHAVRQERAAFVCAQVLEGQHGE